MAKVIGDVMFPGGKYIKDGEEKTRWSKHGILLETDKGMRLKLESMPLGIEPGGGWFSIFEKKDDSTGGFRKTETAKPAQTAGEPDIPF